MEKRDKLNRREFLRLSAITAAAATLVACGAETQPTQQAGVSPAPATEAEPSPAESAAATTDPTPAQAPSSFSEAPMLKEQVDAGELPPVAERLPTNPLVIAHPWQTIGNYGGSMRWSTTDVWGTSHFIQESMYGNSPLRYLNDGQDIGPGWVESWESNDDMSEWTLHIREGLKWSDGEPFTADAMVYWWEDLVLNPEHSEGPPDEARSGTGTLMTLEKVDDVTLRMIFDAPGPLTPDRLATWVNAGIGPRWIAPGHYLKQFHPRYNDQVEDYTEHDQKMDWPANPEAPTLTGWRPVQYEEGVRSVWERNPYYWCVDAEGNQLPYMDGIIMTRVQDPEAQKLGIMEGEVDYVHGGFTGLLLTDISALRDAKPRSGLELLLWDSGSGTASIFFFNQDYRDDKMRELIRDSTFRQALSHAYNRPDLHRTLYFESGEITTGTYSPKAIEYHFNEEAEQRYAEWRDSYVAYDPEKAKALLDEIGVVDKDGDGIREMPDGSKLNVRLDFAAPGDPEHIHKNEALARDWRAIGINANLNPVPPSAYDPQWVAGELMSKTDWEASDGPNHLVNPTWLVPIESARWAPLQGSWYAIRGTEQEGTELDTSPWDRSPPRLEPEEGGPIERLWQLYDQARVEIDPLRRHQLVWDMVKVHVEDGPFFMGVVANYPRIVLFREGMRNVPTREDLPLNGYVNTWIHPTPAAYDPEAYYWDDPAAHS